MQAQQSTQKIFKFDKIVSQSRSTQDQYIAKHWLIIEKCIISYLMDEGQGISIVQMKRSLQTLLTRHKYNLLQQNLIKLFYSIYGDLLTVIEGQSNCILSLLAYYINKKQKYKIMFDLLNGYLNVYAKDKQTIEEKAYKILCKTIVNSSKSEKIMAQILNIINRFRTTKDQNEVIQLQFQLKIIAFLGIYQFCDLQFLERSKIHFVSLSENMIKNQQIFDLINQGIKRQTILNKILKPSQNTIRYLQKQLIQQYYPFMIQYLDSLILLHKLDKIKMLWTYSLRLKQEQKQLLLTRLKEIIKDSSKYLKEDENIYGIIQFMQYFTRIIQECFDMNKTVSNLLYNTIEEILIQNQKRFNEILSKKIFYPSQIYNNEILHQLFKLLPNKEKFIKQFQIRFFRWILNNEAISIIFQTEIIQMIRKECGFALCKKLDRMINDVWRDGEMLYYHHPSKPFKCRLICSNDWPKFNYQNINLPDSLSNIIVQFESQLKKQPQNNYKELTWINEFGIIQLSINGIRSIFSQHEAAVIFILNKSFRPMKKNQLIQILQCSQTVIDRIINELTMNSIILQNEMNETYEINDDNMQPYKFIKQQKEDFDQITILSKRDDTIIVEAYVIRIMKRKKVLPKTDLTKLIYDQIKQFKPTIEQINKALQRLISRDFIDIDKMKGIIRYRQ